jgi:hypothetical protein
MQWLLFIDFVLFFIKNTVIHINFIVCPSLQIINKTAPALCYCTICTNAYKQAVLYSQFQSPVYAHCPAMNYGTAEFVYCVTWQSLIIIYPMNLTISLATFFVRRVGILEHDAMIFYTKFYCKDFESLYFHCLILEIHRKRNH